MHVDDLILDNLTVPSAFEHVQRRLADFSGISPYAAPDIGKMVRAYCLIHEAGSVLDDLVDSRQTLEKIAEQVGVSFPTEVQRAKLIGAIVERGLGFRPLSLAGSSNYRAKIERYQHRFVDPQLAGRRRSPEELRQAGIHCASIIEQTLKDIFAAHRGN